MNTSDINELVTQLQQHTDDVTAEEAARDLRELASLDEATRDAVYRTDTIFALVARMRPRSAAGVLEEVAQALAILVRSEQAALQAMVCNAPRALVQLLQHDSKAVRFEAATALREMAGGASSSVTTSIKNDICKEGALVHLVELLGSDSWRCRVEAARALRVLARGHSDSQAGIVAAGGVAALIRLLSDDSRDVQGNVVGALICLAGGDAHVRAALAEAGVAEALEQLVQDTEWPLVRGRALIALNWLAAAGALAAAQVADPGMADASRAWELLRQLAEADDAEATNQALAVLAGFCSIDPAAVVAAGGLQLLVQLAEQDDATTCQLVARCLRRIVADQAQNTAAVEAEAIPALVSLLEYDESADEAAWALWHLTQGGDPEQEGNQCASAIPQKTERQIFIMGEIWEEGAIPLLADLLRTGSNAEKEAAAAVLGVLSSQSSHTIAAAVREAGIVPVLLDLVRSRLFSQLQEQAVQALRAQSDIPDGRSAIALADGIPTLVHMLSSLDYSTKARGLAAQTLNNFTRDGAQLVASGAIPVMVAQLEAVLDATDFSMQPDEPHVEYLALLKGLVQTLGNLAHNSAARQRRIAAEDAIPLLCRLLSTPQCQRWGYWGVQHDVAKALCCLAENNATNGDAIAECGGVPLLVGLLEAAEHPLAPGAPAGAPRYGGIPTLPVPAEARCLRLVAESSQASWQAVADEGGIEALAREEEARRAALERHNQQLQ